jgi:hypothetical protein
LLVEPADRFLSDGAIGVVHKCEPARPAGFPIGRQDDLRWCADARQMFAKIRLGRRVRQVADEQTD